VFWYVTDRLVQMCLTVFVRPWSRPAFVNDRVRDLVSQPILLIELLWFGQRWAPWL